MRPSATANLKNFFAALGVTAALFFMAAPVHAAYTIVPDCARNQGKEAPSLNCALQTFSNIAILLLGITGSFALLMFVYGGFTLLSSGGSSEKVSKGKTIITNAIIGIVIIMGSGMLIQYGLSKLNLKVPVVGQTCSEAGKAGTVIQTPDGQTKCVFACEGQGFSCLEGTETAGCFNTADCQRSSGKQCCLKAGAPTP